jgi:hypothetical protein
MQAAQMQAWNAGHYTTRIHSPISDFGIAPANSCSASPKADPAAAAAPAAGRCAIPPLTAALLLLLLLLARSATWAATLLLLLVYSACCCCCGLGGLGFRGWLLGRLLLLLLLLLVTELSCPEHRIAAPVVPLHDRKHAGPRAYYVEQPQFRI